VPAFLLEEAVRDWESAREEAREPFTRAASRSLRYSFQLKRNQTGQQEQKAFPERAKSKKAGLSA